MGAGAALGRTVLAVALGVSLVGCGQQPAPAPDSVDPRAAASAVSAVSDVSAAAGAGPGRGWSLVQAVPVEPGYVQGLESVRAPGGRVLAQVVVEDPSAPSNLVGTMLKRGTSSVRLLSLPDLPDLPGAAPGSGAGAGSARAQEPAELLDSIELPGGMFGEGLTQLPDGSVAVGSWSGGTTAFLDLARRAGGSDRDRSVQHVASDMPVWGMCTAGSAAGSADQGPGLVVSDGTEVLSTRDVDSLLPTGSTSVHRRDGAPVTGLNELECLGTDTVLAMVFPTSELVLVDRRDGVVLRSWDLDALREAEASLAPLDERNDVLNGVAVLDQPDEAAGPSGAVSAVRVVVAGKGWSHLYVLDLQLP